MREDEGCGKGKEGKSTGIAGDPHGPESGPAYKRNGRRGGEME